VSGTPPVSKEVKAAVSEAASSSTLGTHVPGQDAAGTIDTAETGVGEKKVKSEKELERERKKAEKQAKFDQKTCVFEQE
jgi:valyl-tRNA synthetase